MGEANEEKITKLEDLLPRIVPQSGNTDLAAESDEEDDVEQVRKVEKQDLLVPPPRGKPKSGRIWKSQKTRFSSIVKTRGIRLSFEKKQKLREDLKRVKEMSRSIKEQKKAEKEAKKQRRIENLRRAEENRKKSEVVQVIKNTAKLKRMKKKQLRMIEKRDTTNM